MSNTVVWYDSAETGAPTLNNAAGSLDAVLHACLVTGFRVLTLDSVTVTANVATATVTSGHGYGNGRIVEMAGAAAGGRLAGWRWRAGSPTPARCLRQPCCATTGVTFAPRSRQSS